MAKTKPPTPRPGHPLPVDWRPFDGIKYMVRDGDTWKNLAPKWLVDVDYLVWFNFHTNNSDEVNWYLHRNVGCRKETPDRFNYIFSSDDRKYGSGAIYRPPVPGIETTLELPGPLVLVIPEEYAFQHHKTDLGEALRKADQTGNLWNWISLGLDFSGNVFTGLALANVEIAGALGLGLEIVGPAASLVGLGLAIGSPHYEAVNEEKVNNTLRGLSQGIVLGASGESWAFIKGHFIARSENFNLQYQNERKNFQNAYLNGLVKGIAYGRQLNKYERRLFFTHLDYQLKNYPAGKFWYTKHTIKDGMVREDYYLKAAGAFRKEALSQSH
jgi:hypothetical protein